MTTTEWRERLVARTRAFDAWLRARSFWAQIGVLYAGVWAVALIAGPVKVGLEELLGVWFPPSITTMSAGAQLFGGVVLAPLLETWVAQTLILDDLAKVRFFGARPRLLFVLSTVFFGLQHFYSPGYILYGCAIGMVLAYAFIVTGRHARGFWATVLVHAAWNFTVFCVHRWLT